MCKVVTLDCRRLLCPMPVIRIQDAIKGLEDGDEVVATCTDPGVKNDVPAWCRINGHEVKDIEVMGNDIVIRVIARLAL